MNPVVFTSLATNVILNHCFIPMFPNCIHVITVCPELTSPKQFLNFRVAGEYFTRSDAFDYLGNSFWGKCWHRLEKKMDMILISANFNWVNFIALTNNLTSFFESLFYFRCKHLPAIFGRTNEMVKQKRFVMAFDNVFAHANSLSLSPRSKLRGIN